MTEVMLYDYLLQGLMLLAVISSLLIFPAMLVGFLSSLLQAATQIQEQTLSFVPKLITVVGIIFFCSEYIWQSLVDYFNFCLLR